MKKKLIAMICFMLMIMMTACGAAKDAESKVPEASGETEDETAAEEETKEQGPGVENLRLQAEEAIENEDFDGALSLAKEAGAIDPAAESAIKDQVKDAWGKKIDSAIDSDDYETAMSLIEEGNKKLDATDFEEKFSGIPDAVVNHVQFADGISVENPVYVIFTEKKGDDWYINEDPKCTSKDTGCTLTVTDVKEAETEDGQKEYTIDFEQDVRYTAVYPASYEKTYWFYYLESLCFYDYYTGRRFNVSEMSMDVGQNSREEKTVNRINWKGKEQDIVIGSKKERAEGEVDYGEGDGFYEDTCKPVLKYTYTVTCPKDYDGLCAYVIKPECIPADAEERNKKLSFDENGKMIDKENEDGEFYTFKDEDDLGYIPKPDDLLMMRIEDYLRSKGADQT